MKAFLVLFLLGITSVASAQSESKVWTHPKSLKRWVRVSEQMRSFNEAIDDCRLLSTLSSAEPWRLPTRQELDEIRLVASTTPFAKAFEELIWPVERIKDIKVVYYGPTGDFLELSAEESIAAAALCVVGVDESEPLQMKFIPVAGQAHAIQETEVTRGQWKSVMGYYPETMHRLCTMAKDATDQHPASCVSAYDAERFANEMTRKNDGYTYRLPTEQEWEMAAGNIGGSVYGWCLGNAGTGPHPVKKLKPMNGLYDMVGNLSEWTSSNFGGGSGSTRIARGGQWNVDSRFCSTSIRVNFTADGRGEVNGFRLVRQSNALR
jgi:formylglycine-generating enzyme required for sulfatase activity